MTDNAPTTTQPAQTATPAGDPQSLAAAQPAAGATLADPSALEAEVARRVQAVERRWQSRKDRELNRARRRWESEAGQAIDPDLLAWIAQADPHDVGQWLKAGLAETQPTPTEPAAGPAAQVPPTNSAGADRPAPAAPEPPRSTEDDQSQPKAPRPAAHPGATSQAPEAPAAETDASPSNPPHADPDPQPAPPRPSTAPQADPATAEATPQPDLEREARARERLAEQRSRDPVPDLTPSRGAPADAFHQIEAAFARGEVDLETYETARRRRGLT